MKQRWRGGGLREVVRGTVRFKVCEVEADWLESGKLTDDWTRPELDGLGKWKL